MIQADLNIILPEILLAVYAMLALVGAGLHRQRQGGPHADVGDWRCVCASGNLDRRLNGSGDNVAFNGMFHDDAFSRFAKVAMLLAGAAVSGHGAGLYAARRGMLRFEYPVLVALAMVGMMTMVSAGDLMALYMGLELQSLVALRRRFPAP